MSSAPAPKVASKKPRAKSARIDILFTIAWKNLAAKKLRSLLTIFGVVIGIGAIFFLLSFGLGLQQLVTNEVIGDQSVKSIEVTSPNSRLLQLNDEFANDIKQFAYVDRVGVQYSFPGSLQRSGAEIDSVVYGIDTPYQDMTTLNLTAGRYLEPDDLPAILINLSALKSLGEDDPKAVLGQKLEITIPLQGASTSDVNELKGSFEVVGILDSGSGAEVFMPKDNFALVGVLAFNNVKVMADDAAHVATVRSHIESKGFLTSSPADTLGQINQIFRFFTIIMIGFGSIGMVVSILGMFNTLTISLLERTREIGLMMALGARNSDMRKLFVFEAVLISFIGAVVGILLAIIGGKILNFFMNQFSAKRGVTESFELFSTPLWAVGMLILFTVAVGLLVVYIPARRAQKINPIDALRRE